MSGLGRENDVKLSSRSVIVAKYKVFAIYDKCEKVNARMALKKSEIEPKMQAKSLKR